MLVALGGRSSIAMSARALLPRMEGEGSLHAHDRHVCDVGRQALARHEHDRSCDIVDGHPGFDEVVARGLLLGSADAAEGGDGVADVDLRAGDREGAAVELGALGEAKDGVPGENGEGGGGGGFVQKGRKEEGGAAMRAHLDMV
jgi:hypothetical protein